MRRLAFSSMVLTASLLVVAPGCKDKAADADKAADKAGADKKASNDKKASDDKPTVANPDAVPKAAGTPVSAFPTSVALIPESAEFVVGLNPKLIVASPMYALAAPEMAKDEQAAAMMTSLKDCGIDPGKLDSVVVGLSSVTEDFVAVVMGQSVGTDAKASCLIKTALEQAGAPEAAKVVTHEGKKMIQFTGGRAYLVDDRTLAVATTSWEAAVGGLIDGKGTSTISGAKKDLFAKVNPQTGVWGVADVPVQLSGMAPVMGLPAEMASVKTVSGSIDLRDGAAINLVAGFEGADKAKAVSTQLTAMLGAATVPPEFSNIAKTIKIEAVDTDLKISLSATMADLNAAKAAAPPI